MITYIGAFIFYTAAMIGLLLVGFIVYKKMVPAQAIGSKGLIEILDSVPVGNKKLLMIVKVKNEKFLIASGFEHTTFLAKLDMQSAPSQAKDKFENVIQAQSELQARNEIQKINEQKTKLFKELYEKDENEKLLSQVKKMDKQKLVKQLLKELSEQKAN